MPQANGEIVLAGNLFPRDPNTELFLSTPGFDAFLRLEVSTRAVILKQEEQLQKIDQIKANTDLIPVAL